jgi:hypothetical protein
MQKLNAAEMATTKIQEHAREAGEVLLNSLGGRIMINASGIFCDPSVRCTDLLIAKEKIGKALALLKEPIWPTNADYDDAEKASDELDPD